ncbi:MAG: polyamine aminopropyltransferase [Bacteroidetes bacterium]|jgi:spermidine synthase|nr:polyamine aminopropyltransferase [Bacteroidota bacterium]
MRNKSYVLKVALFATGLAGIVAEFILSTLATYFLGDPVLQWSLILSIMLFAMGVGSRISQLVEKYVLEYLVFVELALSILSSLSALFVYVIAAYSIFTGFFIYFLSILIGLLIGMEIPLVTRFNEKYESLRYNIASVLEKDYLGSLLGGIFFAFFGLPLLGITYTPFVLGILNFLVAIWLIIMLREFIHPPVRKWIVSGFIFSAVLIAAGLIFAKPIELHSDQLKYKDKIILQKQSRYQKIVLTQWKEDYWLFLDGNHQLSTIDEFMYHEPLVHPAMSLLQHPTDALVIGGGDGCVARELLKYPTLENIAVVDLDPAITKLARENEIFLAFNEGSMNHPKVEIFNQDGFQFLEQTNQFYDIIIVDLPDPNKMEINKLYTLQFYELVQQHLRPYGVFITQAGSPYYAPRAFNCIEQTMQASGFHSLPMHNQVLTLGQWGWILGSQVWNQTELKKHVRKANLDSIPTKWLNEEALELITSFGKPIFNDDSVEVNTIANPVLYQYYRHGRWDLY